MSRTSRLVTLVTAALAAFFLTRAPRVEADPVIPSNETPFTISVAIDHSSQTLSASVSHALPGVPVMICFELTYDQNGSTATSQISILRMADAFGTATFSTPLATVANVGSFMAITSAYYYDSLAQSVVATVNHRVIAGLHLSDVAEVANFNYPAYLQLMQYYSPPSSPAPIIAGDPLPTAWTPLVPGGQSSSSSSGTPITGPGMWTMTAGGPEGIIVAQ